MTFYLRKFRPHLTHFEYIPSSLSSLPRYPKKSICRGQNTRVSYKIVARRLEPTTYTYIKREYMHKTRSHASRAYALDDFTPSRKKRKKNTSPTDLQVPPIFLQLKSSLFTPIALKGEAGASTVFIVYNYVSMNHVHETCDTQTLTQRHANTDTHTGTNTPLYDTHACMSTSVCKAYAINECVLGCKIFT